MVLAVVHDIAETAVNNRNRATYRYPRSSSQALRSPRVRADLDITSPLRKIDRRAHIAAIFLGTSNNPSFRIVPTRVFVKDQSEGIKRSI